MLLSFNKIKLSDDQQYPGDHLVGAGEQKLSTDKTMKKILIIPTSLYIGILFSILVVSCDDVIYDKLEPCETIIQFNYDYNMAYTNQFGRQTEQVSLFVFDNNGKFVTVISDKKDSFENDYGMSLNLDPGKYTFIAYSGLDDNYAKVNLVPGTSTPEDLKVLLNRNSGNISNTELKPLLYGIIKDKEIKGSLDETITIPMMKLSNKIRIVFQDLSKESTSQIDVNNYDFEITGANGKYDGTGNSLTDDLLHYTPYYKENIEGGGAAVEINTLRLISDKDYRLIIRNKQTGEELLNTDLINLLLQTKLHENSALSNQEYLDRQDTYAIVFAFDGKPVTKETFISVGIWINGWIIREQGSEI